MESIRQIAVIVRWLLAVAVIVRLLIRPNPHRPSMPDGERFWDW
jgi:hypothetical protein